RAGAASCSRAKPARPVYDSRALLSSRRFREDSGGAEQLVRVGHADAAHSARAGLVVAPPPDGRRVEGERRCGRGVWAWMTDAVDVRGIEVETATRPVLRRPLAHPTVLLDPEPVLEEDSVAHAHRSRRAVVVVVAGVLAVDPADEPDVEVGVAIELL